MVSDNAPIPFGRPMLDSDDIDAVVQILSGTTLVHGPVTMSFEQAFADRVGTQHAISVSSCTAALHLSLLVNDIGPGDEVLVPAMTHVATAHAIEYCGAKPVFVDVEDDTGNICPNLVEASLTRRTKAVMVVHFLGLPCDMNRILAIAEECGAFVVEDCALALDATYAGQKSGSLGLTGCFSFYPIKHMTTIEGGMVTTNDESTARAITQRKAFGYDKSLGERTKPGIYDVSALGYNYRMNEVEAAIGLAQLSKLDGHQTARAANYRVLRECLQECENVTVFEPAKNESISSHYCLNAILPRDGSIDRDAVVSDLKAAGIGTSVHYPRAVPSTQYYREKYGYRDGQFPIAEWMSAKTISLPVGPHVGPGDAERIGVAFKAAIETARRGTTTD